MWEHVLAILFSRALVTARPTAERLTYSPNPAAVSPIWLPAMSQPMNAAFCLKAKHRFLMRSASLLHIAGTSFASI